MALEVAYGYTDVYYEWSGLSEDMMYSYSVGLFIGETYITGITVAHESITDFTKITGSFLHLSEGTTYTIWCYLYDSSGVIRNYSHAQFTTKVHITKWSWSASNGSASAAKTRQFYNVLIGDASPDDGFSYLVWNDLVDKVDEVLRALGRTWYAYQSYGKSRCKVSIGETFSASKLNEVRYQLRSFASGAMYDRVAGEEILGSYITNLTNYINTAIDSVS